MEDNLIQNRVAREDYGHGWKNNNNFIIDELNGEGEDSLTDTHADQVLWKVSQLEREISEIKKTQEESREFYDRKIDSVQKQISYRINLLETFMTSKLASGKKTVKTPNGTLKMTTRTRKEFGEDLDLIKFSYDNQIPTLVTERPNKKAIASYIKETGNSPQGYNEKTETTFSLKTNNN